MKIGNADVITYDALKKFIEENMHGAKLKINEEGELIIKTGYMVGVDGNRLTRHAHSLYYEWHSNT
jgi:hypothetical protein